MSISLFVNIKYLPVSILRNSPWLKFSFLQTIESNILLDFHMDGFLGVWELL